METRALTYEELGLALKITPASAKRLAIRRKWPKTLGNDGKSRVAVPIERLTQPLPSAAADTSDDIGAITRDAASDSSGDDAGDKGDTITSVLTRHIERLEAQITGMSVKLQAIETARDAERERANLLAAEAAAAAALRQTVETLKAALDSEKRHGLEARAERDEWRKLATAPRGLFAWFRRSA